MLENQEDHVDEYNRVMEADVSYPIDIMENKGQWLILDGLHRFMKAVIRDEDTIKVRIIPRERIPEIEI